jgi:polysaccharide biosynthesis/export protein
MKMARISAFARSLMTVALLLLASLPAMTSAHADDAAQPASYRPSESASDSYIIGTGDKLRVIVFGEDDLGGTFDVDGNGYVSLPLIGQVKVAGLSSTQVEQTITSLYANGYLKEPRVNVEIAQYRPFYVIGQVNKPGEYPYVNDMSLPNAIALAGGYTDKAEQGGVYIRRNGQTTERYYDADSVVKIYPGDVVRIPSSLFWVGLTALAPFAGIFYNLKL